jgi:hypothetical protein
MSTWKTSGKNDRAIELSGKSHVELALYARGLEIERNHLADVLERVRDVLRSLAAIPTASPNIREQVHGLLTLVEERPGLSGFPSAPDAT